VGVYIGARIQPKLECLQIAERHSVHQRRGSPPVADLDIGFGEMSFDKSVISVANRLKHSGAFPGSHCGKRE
jgi:hypothetical protein